MEFVNAAPRWMELEKIAELSEAAKCPGHEKFGEFNAYVYGVMKEVQAE